MSIDLKPSASHQEIGISWDQQANCVHISVQAKQALTQNRSGEMTLTSCIVTSQLFSDTHTWTALVSTVSVSFVDTLCNTSVIIWCFRCCVLSVLIELKMSDVFISCHVSC